MKSDWPLGRCILCLDESKLSDEHLIPSALGGILNCSFLCRACNSWFGSRVEAFAKSDPSVLLAVRKLRGQVPEKLQRLIENHPVVATGERPRASGHLQEGAFRAKPNELADGSLILPTDQARNAITKTLKRNDYEEGPIDRALKTLGLMPFNLQKITSPL